VQRIHLRTMAQPQSLPPEPRRLQTHWPQTHMMGGLVAVWREGEGEGDRERESEGERERLIVKELSLL
jgi:hypothetical protein